MQLDIPQLEHSISSADTAQSDLALAVDVINHALQGIPEERVRLDYRAGAATGRTPRMFRFAA